MLYGIEELSYIQIQHPIHFLFADAITQCIQCIVLASCWPETIREPFKISFINLIDERGIRVVNYVAQYLACKHLY